MKARRRFTGAECHVDEPVMEAAALYVCGQANDPTDARYLLDALGITPSVKSVKRTEGRLKWERYHG